MRPTDRWEWDAEAGEVVALDVDGKRDGVAVPVEFTDEPVGILIAAAPDMARALLAHGRLGVEANGEYPVWHTHACWERNMAVCTNDCERDGAALRKADVL